MKRAIMDAQKLNAATTAKKKLDAAQEQLDKAKAWKETITNGSDYDVNGFKLNRATAVSVANTIITHLSAKRDQYAAEFAAL